MTTKPFGVHPETGEPLTLTTVTSKPHGLIEVSFTNIGASIVSWKIGRIGKKKELVLGFQDGASYLAPPSANPFFGLRLSCITNFQGQQSGELRIALTKPHFSISMDRTTS